MLVSRQRQGTCQALRWDNSSQRYVCGLLTDPQGVLPRLPGWARRGMQALAQRAISAGSGCDCSLQEHPSTARRSNNDTDDLETE